MLDHLVTTEEAKSLIDNNFDKLFYEEIINGARDKMGLGEKVNGDQELYESLLQVMSDTGADFTKTFRTLSDLKVTPEGVDLESRAQVTV